MTVKGIVEIYCFYQVRRNSNQSRLAKVEQLEKIREQEIYTKQLMQSILKDTFEER